MCCGGCCVGVVVAGLCACDGVDMCVDGIGVDVGVGLMWC